MTRTAPCPQRGCCRAKRGTSPGKDLKNLKNKFQKRHTPPPPCRRGAKRPVCRHSVPMFPKNAPPPAFAPSAGYFFLWAFGKLAQTFPGRAKCRHAPSVTHRCGQRSKRLHHPFEKMIQSARSAFGVLSGPYIATFFPKRAGALRAVPVTSIGHRPPVVWVLGQGRHVGRDHHFPRNKRAAIREFPFIIQQNRGPWSKSGGISSPRYGASSSVKKTMRGSGRPFASPAAWPSVFMGLSFLR